MIIYLYISLSYIILKDVTRIGDRLLAISFVEIDNDLCIFMMMLILLMIKHFSPESRHLIKSDIESIEG